MTVYKYFIYSQSRQKSPNGYGDPAAPNRENVKKKWRSPSKIALSVDDFHPVIINWSKEVKPQLYIFP